MITESTIDLPVHFLLLVQKKMDQKKRSPCENSSRPVLSLRRTILKVPLAAPLPRQNRLPPPPTGLNFRKGLYALVRGPTEIDGGCGIDTFKGYKERGRFDFGVLSWLLLCTSKEVTAALHFPIN